MPKLATLLNRKTLNALGWTDTEEQAEKMRREFAAKKKLERDEDMIRRLEKEWDEKDKSEK